MDTLCIITNTTEVCQDYCGERCGELLGIMSIFLCVMCCLVFKILFSSRIKYQKIGDEEEGEEGGEGEEEELVVIGRGIQTTQPPKYHEI